MFLKLVVEMEETYFRFHKWVVMSQDVIWQSVELRMLNDFLMKKMQRDVSSLPMFSY